MKSSLSDINFVKVGIEVWIVAVLVLILISFFVSYPLMLLWNFALVPVLSVVGEVSWLQMWGIVILCNFMFKGYGVTKK